MSEKDKKPNEASEKKPTDKERIAELEKENAELKGAVQQQAMVIQNQNNVIQGYRITMVDLTNSIHQQN